MTGSSMWEYGRGMDEWRDRDITGYSVEATDGSIGKVDKRSDEAAAQSVVVDTGPWIFGQKVLLPASLIERIDHDEEKVYVLADKDRIKNAPEFNESTYETQDYRENLGGYYGGGTAH